MSRLFVTDPPVPVYEFDAAEVVSDTPPSVIWIRARMDSATRGKVQSELVRLGEGGQGIEGHLGEGNLALLIHNIIRWEGALFVDDMGRPIPCTAERIGTLDENDPFIEKVLAEINERNKKRTSPNPKSNIASGSMSDTGGTSTDIPTGMQLATTPSRSPLQTAINGRHERSENLTPITSKNS